MTTTICVANQKGGVGKTTTAISLGAALATEAKQVLLVDLDAQGNASSGLGVGRDRAVGTYDVVLQDRPIPDAIVPTQVPGLALLPSSAALAGAEVELVPLMAREFRLRSALAGAAAYDIVLLDCPPSLGLLTINALTAADLVLIPVQCEFFALEGLAHLLQTIEAVRQRLNPSLEILAIILTMVDARNRLSMQVIEEVRSHFPQLVAEARIPRAVRLAEAPSHGKPISLYDPGSRAAQAYGELARELGVRMAARRPSALEAVS